MNWTYIWGLIAICAIALLFFLFGWISGHSAGRKKGFYEGWEDGCDHTETRMTEEFNDLMPSPLRRNMLDSQRTYQPRPDSAGPMRVHTARIRGDFRLPEKNPDRREPAKPPTPTKLNIKPSDTE